jgi:glutamyl endopeptidase
MASLKTTYCVCAFAWLLAGCGDKTGEGLAGQQTPQQSSSTAAAPEPADEAATGVSSAGETYDLLDPGGRAEGAASGLGGTGEQSPSEELAAEFAALSALQPLQVFEPETVIGADDRTRVANTATYPERANVLIALPGGRCSGAMIGRNLVITAGHCVHGGGSSGAWVTSATVYPGRSGVFSPFGSCQAKKFYSVLGWTRDKNPAYDFGAIKLDCDIGNRVGWMGFWWQSASLIGKEARISSYPGDKPLEQWTHKDQVRRETAQQAFYSTDTMPGNSGSGVFAQTGAPAGCAGPCVHTVHAYGAGTTTTNSGTRITRALFDNLVRWKAEP